MTVTNVILVSLCKVIYLVIRNLNMKEYNMTVINVMLVSLSKVT